MFDDFYLLPYLYYFQCNCLSPIPIDMFYRWSISSRLIQNFYKFIKHLFFWPFHHYSIQYIIGYYCNDDDNNNNYIAMSIKSQLNRSNWNQSKMLFFTPKLSLEGKNMFPQIAQINMIHHHTKDVPFLNILKKPIMSVYQRAAFKSQKKPVCIVGLSKEVESRTVKTSTIKRKRIIETCSNIESQLSQSYKESLSMYTPVMTKSHVVSTNSKVSSKKVIMPHQIVEGSHYYILGSGNNCELMEKILSRRQGWYPTNNSIFHFRWEQARPKYHNINPSAKQILNHLPNHEAITDKGNLHENLKIYCEKYEEHMYRMVPVSFILDFANSESIESQMKKFVQFYWEYLNMKMEESQCQGQSNEKFLQQKDRDRVERQGRKDKNVGVGTRFQKIHNVISANDFDVTLDSPKKKGKDGMRNVSLKNMKDRNDNHQVQYTRKKQQIKILYKNLINSLKPLYHFQDMSNLKKQSPYICPLVCDVYGEKSLWLLKPSDLNRGRGIKLFNSIDQFTELLKHELMRNEKGSFILQKYLEKSMLIEERKFDIRVWAMVTQNRELYFFKEGYIRISSQKFMIDSKNLFTHLTNNAVQKHATNYGEFAQGNILPLNYLFKNNYIKEEDLRAKMKHLIKTSIKAGNPKLYQINQKHQTISVTSTPLPSQKATIQGGGAGTGNKTKHFEIFGYDFMIDVTKNVWLIQVNTNPCIQLSNKWLSSIIPRMLDDAMRLTLDKIFYRKKCMRQGIEELDVEGYSLSQNMWQLLECQNPQSSLGNGN